MLLLKLNLTRFGCKVAEDQILKLPSFESSGTSRREKNHSYNADPECPLINMNKTACLITK